MPYTSLMTPRYTIWLSILLLSVIGGSVVLFGLSTILTPATDHHAHQTPAADCHHHHTDTVCPHRLTQALAHHQDNSVSSQPYKPLVRSVVTPWLPVPVTHTDSLTVIAHTLQTHWRWRQHSILHYPRYHLAAAFAQGIIHTKAFRYQSSTL